MKNAIFIFAVFILSMNISFGQCIPDSRIDSVVSLISTQTIAHNLKELTGDTIAMVGGVPRLIFSRYFTSPANAWAGQYIFEKFQSYGYNPEYFTVDSLCRDVIAVKPGTKYPNQKIIIGGHYDNILWPINPGPFDTVHGADDDGSGTCGVLEMARLLSNMNFEYTIVFAAWDQEEVSPWGAGGYADYARAHGDSIKIYINMDMLAFNYMNQYKFWAGSDTNSFFFNDIFLSYSKKYIPGYICVNKNSENYGSDQLAFIRNGYKVFNVAEFNVDVNPNYHKITDNFANANMPYYVSLLKPTLAMLMAFAMNKTAYFEHRPIASSCDTASRVATVVIKFPEKISTSAHTPRLYYKGTNFYYAYKTAFYRNQDTFKFRIPGFPQGTPVRYYFAAQDTAGTFVCTYPVGGSGVKPPGSIPPPTYFSYEIYQNVSQCSNTCPKPITDNQITLDTIKSVQFAYIVKAKVNMTINHSNDGDLVIQLLRPGIILNLSQRNGQGGQNFINTTFDDDAELSITQGTPPFTGSYRPQQPLSSFNNLALSGNWIIRIVDAAAGNTGTLANWCLLFQLKTSVNIEETGLPAEYALSQNFPNPFNSSTRINYSIANNSNVELKIYDMLGREVRRLVNEYQNAGNYAVMFNAGELASGIYFYKLTTEKFSAIKKLVIIK